MLKLIINKILCIVIGLVYVYIFIALLFERNSLIHDFSRLTNSLFLGDILFVITIGVFGYFASVFSNYRSMLSLIMIIINILWLVFFVLLDICCKVIVKYNSCNCYSINDTIFSVKNWNRIESILCLVGVLVLVYIFYKYFMLKGGKTKNIT